MDNERFDRQYCFHDRSTSSAGSHAEEEQRFIATHPRSAVLAKEAQANLLGGVPMAWMTRWPGSFPIFFDTAQGAHFTDVDGLDYIDFCLGDTGAMTGHGLPQVAEALYAQAHARHHHDAALRRRGVGRGRARPAVRAAGLADGDDRHRRQPVRAAVRAPPHRTPEGAGVRLVLPRHGRRGARDARRAMATPSPGRATSARRSIRRSTTVVVPFNDLAALEAALATGEIACVLAEPALTNIGIVHARPRLPRGAAPRSPARTARCW